MKIFGKNYFIYFCFILISVFQYTNEIFFILDPFEQRCISREMEVRTSFAGVYYISGEKEEGNKALIKDSNNQIIWESNGQKNGSFNLFINTAGIIL